MRILLYNPDNGVTRNFMPHLWMFLLQALTPPGHEVLLIDGNAQPMDETQIAQFVRDQHIGLVLVARFPLTWRRPASAAKPTRKQMRCRFHGSQARAAEASRQGRNTRIEAVKIRPLPNQEIRSEGSVISLFDPGRDIPSSRKLKLSTPS